jgi:DNA-binding winged helix-turn-helix (wHTH) protein
MKSPALIPRVIRFGIFEFNPQTGELRRHGLKIKLEPQASRILSLLLKYPGKVCTRQELQQQLWQDNTLVDFERSLYKGIHTLRGALGDSAIAPRYIETITTPAASCIWQTAWNGNHQALSLRRLTTPARRPVFHRDQ